ncbi:MFS general substrate transporter [Cryphonectria parasitica EP155]|uniref:MFS general substrate transporter n=1 Tax=Cryphonectria parasitica (strain ATCC 38755 / EP155) TaxID=660469 RepID=A0A9P5CSV1_CRYP1|nr:MFS general substrate transporter [Cryphonectria parasitica EP155]KAF3768741.1 MFS general substrate transporter [Cryphonectria parasitica EP155]
MPTPDPRDPLNLPVWRKWAAVTSLSFFGALALASEFIIGALVPVFVLEYDGIDPRILGSPDLGALAGVGGAVNLNPFSVLAGLGGPPVWQVALLSSLPLLMNGVASYVLVPLSIAVGRRPVLLAVGVMAWAGGLWAGASRSLPSHLAARAFQGLGAGAVEALIPLVVQDMMFIHQRNRAISLIGAAQGVFIVSLGIASPIIVVRLNWRYIYWITAGLGVLAWFFLLAFVPESRFIRSDAELAGRPVYALYPGETRPRLDPSSYGPRDKKSNFGILNVNPEWRRARRAVWETIKTSVIPNILWVMLTNSALVSIQGAAGQVGSAVLLAAGWQFEHLGLAVIPVVVASPFVWFFGGYLADRVSNWHAKKAGGRREPEAHLVSLVLPLLCGIAGTVLFGYAADNVSTVPIIVFLISIFLIGFAFLTANALLSVYLVESYPGYAGPVLINISSFRLIIGFALSFDATTWVEQLGFMKSFCIYAAALGIVTLGLPLVYFYGKKIRAFTAGKQCCGTMTVDS